MDKSYQSSDDVEKHNHGKVYEIKVRRNKTKKYQSPERKREYKKTSKIDSSNSWDKRNYKTYNSKNPRTESAENHRKYYSNDKIKSKHHNLDYNTKYRGEEYATGNRKYPSSEKPHNRKKINIGKREREFSKSDRFSKKSNLKGHNYNNKKNMKDKYPDKTHDIPLNDVDYIVNGEDDEGREYFDPNENVKDYGRNEIAEDGHGTGVSDEGSSISDEGGISDENEYSDINEEAHKFKSPREKVKHIRIVTRSMWDDEPGDAESDKLPMKPFNHINYVDTNSPMCENQEDCINVMQFIKQRDKTIKHNFYIGGDDFIYEGKGWVADVNEETGYNKRAVDVAFIGTFSVKKFPKAKMVERAYDFVYYSIISKMIYQNCSSTLFKECHTHG